MNSHCANIQDGSSPDASTQVLHNEGAGSEDGNTRTLHGLGENSLVENGWGVNGCALHAPGLAVDGGGRLDANAHGRGLQLAPSTVTLERRKAPPRQNQGSPVPVAASAVV